jgi:rhodanese-related sulfurtransferase
MKSGLEVPGEIWINPYKTKALEDFVANNDKEKAYVVYCSCLDDGYAIRTAQILTKRGFTNVKVLKNGRDIIENHKLPMEKIKGDDQK